MSLDILDKSVADLKAAIADFSLGELEVLRKAESDGKTRKSALAVIDEAIAAIETPPEEPESAAPPPEAAPVEPCIITPAIVGMTIRLHDGTRLPYGESAETTPEHAAHLRALGLAK